MAGHALEAWAHRHGEWQLLARLQPAWSSIEPPAFVAGPLLLLATGVALVLDGPWGFGDTWIVVGIAGYAAALGLGLAFQAQGIRRLNAVARERGPDDREAVAIARRLHALMWPELALLGIVLLAMTTKPTGAGSGGFWVAVAAILAVAAWPTARGLRAAADPGPEAGAVERGPA